MHRIFTNDAVVPGQAFSIRGDEHRHIAYSLRMRPGEELTVCASSIEYTAVISAVARDETLVIPGEGIPAGSEPELRVTLYVGMPKADKLEHIIKKATELGAVEIVPFYSERTVLRPDAKNTSAKLERWSKIAADAAAQSRRGVVPKVLAPIAFEDAIKRGTGDELCLFCYEGEGAAPLISAVNSGVKSVSAFTGPEGGFSPAEFDTARKNGYNCINLGKRILRCETAPLFLLSVLMFAYGEC